MTSGATAPFASLEDLDKEEAEDTTSFVSNHTNDDVIVPETTGVLQCEIPEDATTSPFPPEGAECESLPHDHTPEGSTPQTLQLDMTGDNLAAEDMEVICSCGSDDMREYESGNVKYRMCRNCWKEEDDCDLHGQMLTPTQNVDVTDSNVCAHVHSHPLLRDVSRDKVMSLSTLAKRVKWQKSHIEQGEGDRLYPGDHIMWRRPYIICHHAIVTDQNEDDFQSEKCKVIHWAPVEDSKSGLLIEISEKEVELGKEMGTMYRMNYERRIEVGNTTDLVIKRAEALLGLKDYHLFRKNCENFARFCKTGVHFNLQYPWLKRKLDQAATSTLVKSMIALLFADFVRVDFGMRFHILGSFIIFFLEFLSLVTDLSNGYFQYKYPTSYLRPLRAFQDAIVMRIFEFIFGSAGMIAGVIGSERLCIYIGDWYCPGNGTLVGYALGALVFGILGGFILGVAGKALGNAIGIQITQLCNCCPAPDQSSDKPDVPIDAEAKIKKRKMVRRYLARSLIAQGGIMLVIFGFILLLAYLKYYVKIYNGFIDAKKTKCITQDVIYLSKVYPCPVVYIELFNQSGSGDYSDSQSDGSNYDGRRRRIQIFENERTFYQRSCSYQPRCRENDTKTAIEMNEYIERFGKPGTEFSCYFLEKNPSAVIRKRESIKVFIVVFVTSSILIFVGACLVFSSAYKARRKWRKAIVEKKKKILYKGQVYIERVDSWPVTFISVLGLTSYLYAFRWLNNCRHIG